MIEFAIVGLGSWGICVLERSVNRARQSSSQVRVHVVEPGQLGGGVYSSGQPDYLVLNNPCGQLSLYASPDGDDDHPYAKGLYDWAVDQGYHWVGYECRIGVDGIPLQETDYLPRRLMGEYLAWFCDELISNAPPNLEVVRHFAAATDITSEINGRETVWLDNGTRFSVDAVVLTSGHTLNTESHEGSNGVRYVRPYPVEYFDEVISPGDPVAIAGMGLVGYDLLTALTIGRGGTHKENGERNVYVPSGREPNIVLYSRSGVPYCAKSAHGVDPTGDYQPIVCTPEAFREMTNPAGSPLRRRVDFRSDLLPLLYAEMQCRYYTHCAYTKDGAGVSSAVREQLRSAWQARTFAKEIDRLVLAYGDFDPKSVLFADEDASFESSDGYQAHVYEMIDADLSEALSPGGSPVKAAQEVTRILRDQMRSVIEYGGLTLQSFVDFQSNVRGRINRIEAGPPPLRSQQLLALIDAGVVTVPLGPFPDVEAGEGSVVLRSTRFESTVVTSVKAVIRGHLDLPSLSRSSSALLSRLYTMGRLTQFSYGDTTVGSVAISEDFHPFDAEGRLQSSLFLLGVLTEGVRYFTHYLPSPRSRLRAVHDAQRCIEAIIA